MTQYELTVVIPTFNEGDIIEASLKRVSAELGDLRSETEVIIADDGTDDLPAAVERCGVSCGFGAIRVIRNKTSLGKGDSIALAFRVAAGKVVGFIDVDFSVAPSYIHAALKEIQNGSDVCIASRVGNRFKSDHSVMTSISASAFSFVHRRIIFGRKKNFRDTQCGFKFFKREVAVDLYRDLVASDGLADLEVLLKAVQKGYTVSEIEVPRINDREGKRKLSRIIAYETISLWRIYRKYRI